MKTYDCVVVGTGPAGSTAARRLAAAGARVLLLEKERLPRYKTCGGAISGLTARLLDVPGWEKVSERQLEWVEVRYRLGPPLFCKTDGPYAHFVMRDRFDYLLAQAAVAAGAELLDGCEVTRVQQERGGVALYTSRGKFNAAAVIGADGAHSVVAKTTGLSRPSLGAALEAEVDVTPGQLAEWSQRVLVSYGDPACGYGWVFPKAHHLSIGVGTLKPHHPRLPQRLEAFLTALGLGRNPRRVRGHPIPLPGNRLSLSAPRVLLAGDAAGLADPLSGEGIAHAVRSGQLAADAVAEALATGDFRFVRYSQRIQREILDGLHAARRVAHLFYRMPQLFFTLFQKSPGTLSFYFEIVQGKATYRELVRRVHRDLIRAGLTVAMGKASEREVSSGSLRL